MTKVFIDGSAGTTGLRIYERLEARNELELIVLPDELRKDEESRKQAIFEADIAFLCLPDAAAIEAVELSKGSNTVIIDTSTAHRTDPAWIYGFPELTGKKELIRNAKKITNPGCHATGFISLVAPLVENGLVNKDVFLTCFSITGYSGGGKKMIADYETPDSKSFLSSPRQYGITQNHKHLKEMTKISGLENTPVFCPIVSDFYSGMEVTVPIFAKDLKGNIQDVKNLYKSYYSGKLITYSESDEEGFLATDKMSFRDDMLVSVFGNEDRILLVSRFDNLGKGASGAAIQNMNIVLGLEETTGLNIGG